jgi:hypothetical protein
VSEGITYVGLDAHKGFISVAMLLPSQKQPVEWEVVNQPADIKRLAKKLEKQAPGEIRCCYEAGPVGDALKRQLEAGKGMICEVIAPALIPVKAGDRIKTDRRDARKLAELLRAGLLTEVEGGPDASASPPGEVPPPAGSHLRRQGVDGDLQSVARDAEVRARSGTRGVRRLRAHAGAGRRAAQAPGRQDRGVVEA